MCLVTQSCPTLCDCIDRSPWAPLSMGFFRKEVLERIATSFSRGSSHPGIEPVSPCLLHCRQILYPLSHLGNLSYLDMCVYIWTCVYMFGHVCTYLAMCYVFGHIWTYLGMCVYIWTCVHIWTCVYVFGYVLCIGAYLDIFGYVCIHLDMCVCICIYMYIFEHVSTYLDIYLRGPRMM